MVYMKDEKAAWERRKYRKRRDHVVALLGGQCAECPATEGLQIDHIDPATKEFAIGQIFSHSWDKVLKEAAKCQLLCEPCHIEKTRREQSLPITHGTRSGYMKHECRCDPCRGAYAAYKKTYRDNRAAKGLARH